MDRTGSTVIEELVRSLEAAAKFNPDDVVHPYAVLWTDHDSQWQPTIAQLRRLLPQLVTFGDYVPEHRSGPAIWLRSVVDWALPEVELPEGVTPIVYLPGVSRQEMRAVQECPDSLKPLVELQYRGVCWTQKNGKDWTVEAFLVSEEGGLGLDVARDATTRRAMLGALAELATTSVDRLKGKHLDAEDFDRLFSDDPAKDLLLWLSDPEAVRSGWDGGRRAAFKSRCKADLKFDPDKDGELVGAELLGKREGPWATVWERFTESPVLYPGLPELLRNAKSADLLEELSSSWPQNNEKEEAGLRQALLGLEKSTPAKARERVLELEKVHGPRREWVWAKLGHAPLANALENIARLVEAASTKLGGASVAEMAKLYVDSSAWEADTAALSAAAAVKSTADAQAVSKALNAVYRPWLESAAEHLQNLAEKGPLPGHDGQPLEELLVEPGGMVLFADGLRFDVAQRLASRMRDKGWTVTLSMRWAGLPTVTATAKPAVSPVSKDIKGVSLGEDFLPVTADGEQPLTTDRFRKLLASSGYQYVGADENGRSGWLRLDRERRARQVGAFAAEQTRRPSRRTGRASRRAHRGTARGRLARDPCGDGPRLALVARRASQGRSPQVPDGKSLGALRRDQGRLQGGGADRVLALERSRARRGGAWHRVLQCRQRIRPRRLEPPGEPCPGHPGHCGQRDFQGNGRHRGSQLGRPALPRPG